MMDNECRVMLDNDGKSVCRVHGEAWPCPELQRLNALVASATQVRELRPSIWPAPAGGVARRNRADLFTPAERAIYDAVHIVEDAGAHPRLTDAVILLGKAREAVADFVDGVDTPASLAVGEPPEVTATDAQHFREITIALGSKECSMCARILALLEWAAGMKGATNG